MTALMRLQDIHARLHREMQPPRDPLSFFGAVSDRDVALGVALEAGHSLGEIALALGITVSRVAQLRDRASG